MKTNECKSEEGRAITPKSNLRLVLSTVLFSVVGLATNLAIQIKWLPFNFTLLNFLAFGVFMLLVAYALFQKVRSKSVASTGQLILSVAGGWWVGVYIHLSIQKLLAV